MIRTTRRTFVCSRIAPWLTLLAASLLSSPLVAAPRFPFQANHRIAITVDGRVHAMTFGAAGERAYIGAGHAVSAFATADGKLKATHAFKGTVSSLAMSADGQVLYALTRAPSLLLELDPHTLQVGRQQALDIASPGHLLVDAYTHALYVTDSASNAVVRISLDSLKVGATARLGTAVGQIAYNPRGRLYVALPGKPGIRVIDGDSMHALGTYATPDCVPGGALALDPVGRRLFIACRDGRMAILDTDMGFVFRRISLGSAPGDTAIFAFHPAPGTDWKGGVFVVAGDRIVAVRMLAFVRYAFGGSVTFPHAPSVFALNAKAGQIWVAGPASGHAQAGQDSDSITVLDTDGVRR